MRFHQRGGLASRRLRHPGDGSLCAGRGCDRPQPCSASRVQPHMWVHDDGSPCHHWAVCVRGAHPPGNRRLHRAPKVPGWRLTAAAVALAALGLVFTPIWQAGIVLVMVASALFILEPGGYAEPHPWESHRQVSQASACAAARVPAPPILALGDVPTHEQAVARGERRGELLWLADQPRIWDDPPARCKQIRAIIELYADGYIPGLTGDQIDRLIAEHDRMSYLRAEPSDVNEATRGGVNGRQE